MPVQTSCPACSQQVRVPDQLLGKNVKCPKCGHEFMAGSGYRPPPPQAPRGPAPETEEYDEPDEDDDYEEPPRRRRRSPDGLTRKDLHSIAIYQKVIIWCILAYLIAVVAQFAIPKETRILLGLLFLAVAVTATVFVFMLALKVYGTGFGILLGFLTLIPCVGLVTLLIINQKATGLLNKHGYRVGLMGASLSQFRTSSDY